MTIARRWAAALMLSAGLVGQSGPAADVWTPVRFLVGSWEGDAKGEPGVGKSRRDVPLRDVGAFHRGAQPVGLGAPGGNPKGEIHEDRGIISYDRARKRLVLRQFHGEGFVNQYLALDGEGLRFES